MLPIATSVTGGIVTGTFSSFQSPSMAAAAGTCTHYSSAHYFDGQMANGSSNSQISGVQANIVSEPASPCEPEQDNDFYSAWTMIAGDNGNQGWAQSGYIHEFPDDDGQFPEIFAQQTKCLTCFDYNNFGSARATTGSNYKYWTQPDGNGGIESGWCNGSTCHTLEDTTVNKAWSEPFQAQLLGEVVWQETDMPGDSSHPANFTKVSFEKNGSWYGDSCDTSSLVDDNPTQWYAGPFICGQSSDSFEIYSFNP